MVMLSILSIETIQDTKTQNRLHAFDGSYASPHATSTSNEASLGPKETCVGSEQSIMSTIPVLPQEQASTIQVSPTVRLITTVSTASQMSVVEGLSSPHLFQRVSQGVWYYIECGPVTSIPGMVKDIAGSLMVKFSNKGVLRVQCTRQKCIAEQPYQACLYFKNASQRDDLLALFSKKMAS